LPFFTDVSGKSFADIQKAYNLEFAAVAGNLPEEVQIITLEPWKVRKSSTYIIEQ